MKPSDQYLETKVGLFVLIGLAVIAVMVVQFGRFGEGMQGVYQISVRFPDASGLTKGAEVLMSGARIGRVAEDPKLLPYSDGVIVKLNIAKPFKIPASATFRVGSSGLLGDRFVQILRGQPLPDGEAFLSPGAELSGTREPGLDDFVRNSEKILEEARGLIHSLQKAADKIESDILSQKNIQNASQTIESIRLTAEKLSAGADKGERLVSDLSSVGEEIKKVAAGASNVIDRAQTGGGLFQSLMTDKRLAEDFRAFVANIRTRGILFYRDRPPAETGRGGSRSSSP